MDNPLKLTGLLASSYFQFMNHNCPIRLKEQTTPEPNVDRFPQSLPNPQKTAIFGQIDTKSKKLLKTQRRTTQQQTLIRIRGHKKYK